MESVVDSLIVDVPLPKEGGFVPNWGGRDVDCGVSEGVMGEGGVCERVMRLEGGVSEGVMEEGRVREGVMRLESEGDSDTDKVGCRVDVTTDVVGGATTSTSVGNED